LTWEGAGGRCPLRFGAGSHGCGSDRRVGRLVGAPAAVDGGTWRGGGASKRRRRSRLPAPPSRVTLLVRNLEHALALAKALQREAPQVVEAERLPGGELAHHVRDQDLPGPGPGGDARRGLHGGAEEVRVLGHRLAGVESD